MGLCVSSGGAVMSEAAGAPRATALVLLPTGEKGWFLCDSDRMGFEGPVAAVGGDEELRAGRIYFVLPAEAHRRGLRREEVAALARVACSGTGRRRRGSVAPLVFSPPEEEEEETLVAHKAAPAAGKRQLSRPHQRFAPDLTAIPECEMSESE